MVEVTDTLVTDLASTGADNTYKGFEILTKVAGTLISATKDGDDTATTCKIRDTSNVDLATATFSGNVATFNYAITNATTYRVVGGSTGSTMAYNSTAFVETDKTNVTFKNEIYDGSVSNGGHRTMLSVTTEATVNVTVTPSTLTLSTTAQTPTIIVLIIPTTFAITAALKAPVLYLQNPAHVIVGTGASKTRFISKRYPITTGLTAGTTKQKGRTMNLVPLEGSLVVSSERKGIRT